MTASRLGPAARLGRLGAAVVVAALLGGSACTGSPSAPTPPPDTSPRHLLPDSPTALPTYDTTQFRSLLAELRGKPVVVNFWASWCGPCKLEAAELATVARRFQGKAQFVGVDIEDQLPPARAFIHQYGWIYPSVFDPTAEIRGDLNVLGQPVTIVFDANGTQVKEFSGPVKDADLSSELTKLT